MNGKKSTLNPLKNETHKENDSMHDLATTPKIDSSLLPTEDEIIAFKENGWYISRPLFSEEEASKVLHATDRFYKGHLDRTNLPAAMEDYHINYDFPELGIRKSDYASFYIPALYQLLHKPILAAIAAHLVQTPAIRLWHDQLLWKDPQSPGIQANVGWHTDRGYWQACSSDNMITAWIPFHDCNEKTGTITMIDGSHQWPDDNDKALNFFENDLDSLEKKMVTGGKRINKVPMDLKLGQVSFHHCRLIHGSGPNNSEQPRRSVALHLQDQSNTYRRYINPQTGHLANHNNVEFCKQDEQGQPDFSDPSICPVLWNKLEP